MLFKGNFVAAASGKVNGVVASHNRSGSYLRRLVIPVNPSTPFQTDVRNAFSTLSVRWNDILTDLQRQAWQIWAINTPRTNRVGDQFTLTGQNAFISCNTPRLQVGLAIIDDGPIVYNRGSFTLPVPSITAGSDSLSVAFTNSDDWASEVGSSLLIYAGRPVSGNILFFKGPYQFVGRVNGAATPPTSPATMTLPWEAGPVGSRMYFRTSVSRLDGRLSPSFPVDDVA